ncbi:L-histidine N(alpha)-methyltransferase [Microbulbifer hainanensis]|uniref:L-histidine N(alpha)-methyltransferase n=1 Tax=Microbulbifer hainanensis TaxID=2735675 RepID=UPI0018686FC8|nr:L-histidine N(alpha)-methyltransferase [Microbulbifer hainanensis]
MNMATSPLDHVSPETNVFLVDVIHGLRQAQKTLPCKYLYDETGSRLFEKICELRDYYLTRTEAEIFSRYLSNMAEHIGQDALIIEPGAGNCEKVRPLLQQLDSPAGYIPTDISPEILLAARAEIEALLPTLSVQAAVGDFTQKAFWNSFDCPPASKRVIFFPGSTIGNFDPEQARALLAIFTSQLQPGDGLLIGTDLDKDSVILERAYHDSEHVTAAFNKNLLTRINSELQGNFDLSLFAHRAFYHSLRQRVEMHLVCLRSHDVTIAGERIHFREGETIHTENSHKYSLNGFRGLLEDTGFQTVTHWTDRECRYAIHYAQVA